METNSQLCILAVQSVKTRYFPNVLFWKQNKVIIHPFQGGAFMVQYRIKDTQGWDALESWEWLIHQNLGREMAAESIHL